jgi:hypothetical protein
MRVGSKEALLFLKKEAKNFYPFGFGVADKLRAQMDKSFLLLFFKKEALASYPN